MPKQFEASSKLVLLSVMCKLIWIWTPGLRVKNLTEELVLDWEGWKLFPLKKRAPEVFSIYSKCKVVEDKNDDSMTIFTDIKRSKTDE